MAGLAGDFVSVPVVIGVAMWFGAVAFADTGHVDAVMSPIVWITTGWELVVFHLMTVNADYTLGYMDLVILGHGKAAFDHGPATSGFVADHAILDGRPADAGSSFGAAILGHHDLAVLILGRLSFAEVVLGGMADQAVYGLLRLGAGAADIAGMITRVAGVAAGKLGLAEGIRRHFLQVVDDIVTVAHRVDPVFHAILFIRIYIVNMVHL